MSTLGVDYASIDRVKSDWKAARAAGIEFAILRAAWGSWQDPTARAEWSAMGAAGIVRGTYLFLRDGMDPVAQAVAFCKSSPPLGPGDLPPTVDIEFPGGRTKESAARALDDVRAAERVLDDHYGVRCIDYTSGRVWREDLDNLAAPDFSEHPLWAVGPYVCEARQPAQLAGPFPHPRIPPPWGDADDYWLHQVQGDALGVPGLVGAVDLDVFNPLARGARGARVRWLQRRLVVADDGDFGESTEGALIRWQVAQGLTGSGVVDLRSFARLAWVQPVALVVPAPAVPSLVDLEATPAETPAALRALADADAFTPAELEAINLVKPTFVTIEAGVEKAAEAFVGDLPKVPTK